MPAALAVLRLIGSEGGAGYRGQSRGGSRLGRGKVAQLRGPVPVANEDQAESGDLDVGVAGHGDSRGGTSRREWG
jgi:hypothetical protein